MFADLCSKQDKFLRSEVAVDNYSDIWRNLCFFLLGCGTVELTASLLFSHLQVGYHKLPGCERTTGFRLIRQYVGIALLLV